MTSKNDKEHKHLPLAAEARYHQAVWAAYRTVQEDALTTEIWDWDKLANRNLTPEERLSYIKKEFEKKLSALNKKSEYAAVTTKFAGFADAKPFVEEIARFSSKIVNHDLSRSFSQLDKGTGKGLEAVKKGEVLTLEHVTSDPTTALMVAFEKLEATSQTIECLVKLGADVNRTCDVGRLNTPNCPIAAAAFTGKNELVQKLVAMGARETGNALIHVPSGQQGQELGQYLKHLQQPTAAVESSSSSSTTSTVSTSSSLNPQIVPASSSETTLSAGGKPETKGLEEEARRVEQTVRYLEEVCKLKKVTEKALAKLAVTYPLTKVHFSTPGETTGLAKGLAGLQSLYSPTSGKQLTIETMLSDPSEALIVALRSKVHHIQVADPFLTRGLVEFLIRAGADVNRPHPSRIHEGVNDFPIEWALRAGEPSIVGALLNAGACFQENTQRLIDNLRDSDRSMYGFFQSEFRKTQIQNNKKAFLAANPQPIAPIVTTPPVNPTTVSTSSSETPRPADGKQVEDEDPEAAALVAEEAVLRETEADRSGDEGDLSKESKIAAEDREFEALQAQANAAPAEINPEQTRLYRAQVFKLFREDNLDEESLQRLHKDFRYSNAKKFDSDIAAQLFADLLQDLFKVISPTTDPASGSQQERNQKETRQKPLRDSIQLLVDTLGAEDVADLLSNTRLRRNPEDTASHTILVWAVKSTYKTAALIQALIKEGNEVGAEYDYDDAIKAAENLQVKYPAVVKVLQKAKGIQENKQYAAINQEREAETETPVVETKQAAVQQVPAEPKQPRRPLPPIVLSSQPLAEPVNRELDAQVEKLRKDDLKLDQEQFNVFKEILEAAIPVIAAGARLDEAELQKIEDQATEDTPDNKAAQKKKQEARDRLDAFQKKKQEARDRLDALRICETLAGSDSLKMRLNGKLFKRIQPGVFDPTNAPPLLNYLEKYLAERLIRAGEAKASELRSSIQNLKDRIEAAKNGQPKGAGLATSLSDLIEKCKGLPSRKGLQPTEGLQSKLESLYQRRKTLSEDWLQVAKSLQEEIEKKETSLDDQVRYASLLIENVTGNTKDHVNRNLESGSQNVRFAMPHVASNVYLVLDTLTKNQSKLENWLDPISQQIGVLTTNTKFDDGVMKPAYKLGDEQAKLKAERKTSELAAEQVWHLAKEKLDKSPQDKVLQAEVYQKELAWREACAKTESLFATKKVEHYEARNKYIQEELPKLKADQQTLNAKLQDLRSLSEKERKPVAVDQTTAKLLIIAQQIQIAEKEQELLTSKFLEVARAASEAAKREWDLAIQRSKEAGKETDKRVREREQVLETQAPEPKRQSLLKRVFRRTSTPNVPNVVAVSTHSRSVTPPEGGLNSMSGATTTSVGTPPVTGSPTLVTSQSTERSVTPPSDTEISSPSSTNNGQSPQPTVSPVSNITAGTSSSSSSSVSREQPQPIARPLTLEEEQQYDEDETKEAVVPPAVPQTAVPEPQVSASSSLSSSSQPLPTSSSSSTDNGQLPQPTVSPVNSIPTGTSSSSSSSTSSEQQPTVLNPSPIPPNTSPIPVVLLSRVEGTEAPALTTSSSAGGPTPPTSSSQVAGGEPKISSNPIAEVGEWLKELQAFSNIVVERVSESQEKDNAARIEKNRKLRADGKLTVYPIVKQTLSDSFGGAQEALVNVELNKPQVHSELYKTLLKQFSKCLDTAVAVLIGGTVKVSKFKDVEFKEAAKGKKIEGGRLAPEQLQLIQKFDSILENLLRRKDYFNLQDEQVEMLARRRGLLGAFKQQDEAKGHKQPEPKSKGAGVVPLKRESVSNPPSSSITTTTPPVVSQTTQPLSLTVPLSAAAQPISSSTKTGEPKPNSPVSPRKIGAGSAPIPVSFRVMADGVKILQTFNSKVVELANDNSAASEAGQIATLKEAKDAFNSALEDTRGPFQAGMSSQHYKSQVETFLKALDVAVTILVGGHVNGVSVLRVHGKDAVLLNQAEELQSVIKRFQELHPTSTIIVTEGALERLREADKALSAKIDGLRPRVIERQARPEKARQEEAARRAREDKSIDKEATNPVALIARAIRENDLGLASTVLFGLMRTGLQEKVIKKENANALLRLVMTTEKEEKRLALVKGILETLTPVDQVSVINEPNKENSDNTLLHAAAQSDDYAVMEILVHYGANLAAQNREKVTPGQLLGAKPSSNESHQHIWDQLKKAAPVVSSSVSSSTTSAPALPATRPPAQPKVEAKLHEIEQLLNPANAADDRLHFKLAKARVELNQIMAESQAGASSLSAPRTPEKGRGPSPLPGTLGRPETKATPSSAPVVATDPLVQRYNAVLAGCDRVLPPASLNKQQAQQLYEAVVADGKILVPVAPVTTVRSTINSQADLHKKFGEAKEFKLEEADKFLLEQRNAIIGRTSKVIPVAGIGKVRVYHPNTPAEFENFAKGLDAARGALEIIRQAPESQLSASERTALIKSVIEATSTFYDAVGKEQSVEVARNALETALVGIVAKSNLKGVDKNKALKYATRAIQIAANVLRATTFHDETVCRLQPGVSQDAKAAAANNWIMEIERPVTRSHDSTLGNNPWANYATQPWFIELHKRLTGEYPKAGQVSFLHRFIEAHQAELQLVSFSSPEYAIPGAVNAAHETRVQIVNGRVGGAVPIITHTREDVGTPFAVKGEGIKAHALREHVPAVRKQIAIYNHLSTIIGERGEILRARLQQMLNSGMAPKQIYTAIYHVFNLKEGGAITAEAAQVYAEWLKKHPVYYKQKVPTLVHTVNSLSNPGGDYEVVIANYPGGASATDLGKQTYTQLNLAEMGDTFKAGEPVHKNLQLFNSTVSSVVGLVSLYTDIRKLNAFINQAVPVLSINAAMEKIKTYERHLLGVGVALKVRGFAGTGDELTEIFMGLLPETVEDLKKMSKNIDYLSMLIDKPGRESIVMGALDTALRKKIKERLESSPEELKGSVSAKEPKKKQIRSAEKIAESVAPIVKVLRDEQGDQSAVELFQALLEFDSSKLEQATKIEEKAPINEAVLQSIVAYVQKEAPGSQSLLLLQAVTQLLKAYTGQLQGDAHSQSEQTAVATAIVARLMGVSVGGGQDGSDDARTLNALVNLNLLAFEKWGKIISPDNSIKLEFIGNEFGENRPVLTHTSKGRMETLDIRDPAIIAAVQSAAPKQSSSAPTLGARVKEKVQQVFSSSPQKGRATPAGERNIVTPTPGPMPLPLTPSTPQKHEEKDNVPVTATVLISEAKHDAESPFHEAGVESPTSITVTTTSLDLDARSRDNSTVVEVKSTPSVPAPVPPVEPPVAQGRPEGGEVKTTIPPSDSGILTTVSLTGSPGLGADAFNPEPQAHPRVSEDHGPHSPDDGKHELDDLVFPTTGPSQSAPPLSSTLPPAVFSQVVINYQRVKQVVESKESGKNDWYYSELTFTFRSPTDAKENAKHFTQQAAALPALVSVVQRDTTCTIRMKRSELNGPTLTEIERNLSRICMESGIVPEYDPQMSANLRAAFQPVQATIAALAEANLSEDQLSKLGFKNFDNVFNALKGVPEGKELVHTQLANVAEFHGVTKLFEKINAAAPLFPVVAGRKTPTTPDQGARNPVAGMGALTRTPGRTSSMPNAVLPGLYPLPQEQEAKEQPAFLPRPAITEIQRPAPAGDSKTAPVDNAAAKKRWEEQTAAYAEWKRSKDAYDKQDAKYKEDKKAYNEADRRYQDYLAAGGDKDKAEQRRQYDEQLKKYNAYREADAEYQGWEEAKLQHDVAWGVKDEPPFERRPQGVNREHYAAAFARYSAEFKKVRAAKAWLDRYQANRPTSLFELAAQGDVAGIQAFFAEGGPSAAADFDINARDEHGHTALMYAVAKGHVAIVNYLLNRSGIDVNVQVPAGSVNAGFSALQYAVCNMQGDLIPVLRAKGANDIKALWTAVETGNTEAVGALLKAGTPIDVNRVNPAWGCTALVQAVKQADNLMVQSLCEARAEVDLALQEAAKRGSAISPQSKLLLMLLTRATQVGLNNALQSAAEHGAEEVALELLRRRANPNGNAPAAADDDVIEMKAVEAPVAEVKATDRPLHHAVRYGQHKLVLDLLARNVDPNVPGAPIAPPPMPSPPADLPAEENNSALMRAVLMRQPRMVALLRATGAHCSQALKVALQRHDWAMARVLMATREELLRQPGEARNRFEEELSNLGIQNPAEALPSAEEMDGLSAIRGEDGVAPQELGRAELATSLYDMVSELGNVDVIADPTARQYTDRGRVIIQSLRRLGVPLEVAANQDALQLAAARGDRATIESLIDAAAPEIVNPEVKASLEKRDATNGYSALMQAVRYGDLGLVQLFLRVRGHDGNGIDLNMRDREGHTALVHAARSGNVAIAAVLKNAGADCNAALVHAVQRNDVAMVTLLLTEPHNIDAAYLTIALNAAAGREKAADNLGEPARQAQERNNIAIIRLLRRAGATSNTALVDAARYGRLQVVKALVLDSPNEGAFEQPRLYGNEGNPAQAIDLNQQRDGHNALYYLVNRLSQENDPARRDAITSVVNLLGRRGAAPDQAFIHAARCNRLEQLRILMDPPALAELAEEDQVVAPLGVGIARGPALAADQGHVQIPAENLQEAYLLGAMLEAAVAARNVAVIPHLVGFAHQNGIRFNSVWLGHQFQAALGFGGRQHRNPAMARVLKQAIYLHHPNTADAFFAPEQVNRWVVEAGKRDDWAMVQALRDLADTGQTQEAVQREQAEATGNEIEERSLSIGPARHNRIVTAAVGRLKAHAEADVGNNQDYLGNDLNAVIRLAFLGIEEPDLTVATTRLNELLPNDNNREAVLAAAQDALEQNVDPVNAALQAAVPFFAAAPNPQTLEEIASAAAIIAAHTILNNYDNLVLHHPNHQLGLAGLGSIPEFAIHTAYTAIQRGENAVEAVIAALDGDMVPQAELRKYANAAVAIATPMIDRENAAAVAANAAIKAERDKAESVEFERKAKVAALGAFLVGAGTVTGMVSRMGKTYVPWAEALFSYGEPALRAFGLYSIPALAGGASGISQGLESAHANSPLHRNPAVRVFAAKERVDSIVHGLGKNAAGHDTLAPTDLVDKNGNVNDTLRQALIELIEARIHYALLKGHNQPVQDEDSDEPLTNHAVYALIQLRDKLRDTNLVDRAGNNNALTSTEWEYLNVTYASAAAFETDATPAAEQSFWQRTGRRVVALLGAAVVPTIGLILYSKSFDSDFWLTKFLRGGIEDGVGPASGDYVEDQEREMTIEERLGAALGAMGGMSMAIAFALLSYAYQRDCARGKDYKASEKRLQLIQKHMMAKEARQRTVDYDKGAKVVYDQLDQIPVISTLTKWTNRVLGLAGWAIYAAAYAIYTAAYAVGYIVNFSLSLAALFVGHGSLWGKGFWLVNMPSFGWPPKPTVEKLDRAGHLTLKAVLYLPVIALDKLHFWDAPWLFNRNTAWADLTFGQKVVRVVDAIIFHGVIAALYMLATFFIGYPLSRPKDLPAFVEAQHIYRESLPWGWERIKLTAGYGFKRLLSGNYHLSSDHYQRFASQTIASILPIEPRTGIVQKFFKGAGRVALTLFALTFNIIPTTWPNKWSWGQWGSFLANALAIGLGIAIVVGAIGFFATVGSPATAVAFLGFAFWSVGIVTVVTIAVGTIWHRLRNFFANSFSNDERKMKAEDAPNPQVAPVENQDNRINPELVAPLEREPAAQSVPAVAMFADEVQFVGNEPSLGPDPQVLPAPGRPAAPPVPAEPVMVPPRPVQPPKDAPDVVPAPGDPPVEPKDPGPAPVVEPYSPKPLRHFSNKAYRIALLEEMKAEIEEALAGVAQEQRALARPAEWLELQRPVQAHLALLLPDGAVSRYADTEASTAKYLKVAELLLNRVRYFRDHELRDEFGDQFRHGSDPAVVPLPAVRRPDDYNDSHNIKRRDFNQYELDAYFREGEMLPTPMQEYAVRMQRYAELMSDFEFERAALKEGSPTDRHYPFVGFASLERQLEIELKELKELGIDKRSHFNDNFHKRKYETLLKHFGVKVHNTFAKSDGDSAVKGVTLQAEITKLSKLAQSIADSRLIDSQKDELGRACTGLLVLSKGLLSVVEARHAYSNALSKPGLSHTIPSLAEALNDAVEKARSVATQNNHTQSWAQYVPNLVNPENGVVEWLKRYPVVAAVGKFGTPSPMPANRPVVSDPTPRPRFDSDMGSSVSSASTSRAEPHGKAVGEPEVSKYEVEDVYDDDDFVESAASPSENRTPGDGTSSQPVSPVPEVTTPSSPVVPAVSEDKTSSPRDVVSPDPTTQPPSDSTMRSVSIPRAQSTVGSMAQGVFGGKGVNFFAVPVTAPVRPMFDDRVARSIYETLEEYKKTYDRDKETLSMLLGKLKSVKKDLTVTEDEQETINKYVKPEREISEEWIVTAASGRREPDIFALLREVLRVYDKNKGLADECSAIISAASSPGLTW
jgi:ankyrin repeat protein